LGEQMLKDLKDPNQPNKLDWLTFCLFLSVTLAFVFSFFVIIAWGLGAAWIVRWLVRWWRQVADATGVPPETRNADRRKKDD
jgi:predicted alpha/beta hydrolase family esterase